MQDDLILSGISLRGLKPCRNINCEVDSQSFSRKANPNSQGRGKGSNN